MTAASPVVPDEGEEVVVEDVPCACGRLAALLLVDEDLFVTATIRCGCGSFAPPDGRSA